MALLKRNIMINVVRYDYELSIYVRGHYAMYEWH